MTIDPRIMTLISFLSLILGLCATVYGFKKSARATKKDEIKEAQENALKLQDIQNSIRKIEDSVRRIENEQADQKMKDEEIQKELRGAISRLAKLEFTVERHATSLKRAHDRVDQLTKIAGVSP